ncbi:MAG: efflux RND transporter periplasmic adaptor subunit [Gammaproteobacteria bacterium]|nr:efflux RND transporter periplasmic adaptor subunit [Gammaproteobacteria bacterium]
MSARCSSVLIVLLIAGCGDGGASSPPGGGGFGGPPLVVTGTTTVRSIADIVEAVGTTQANESVTITAKVTDSIRHVRFDDGDFVHEGEVLVELTNEEQTALLQEAEASKQDAQTQFDRLNDLLEQQSIPVSDVDEARARLSGARARYQALVARLDDRLIRAPFTGLLGFREVSAGTLITPGTPITTLDDISVIKLDFALPEVYLGVVHSGLSLTAASAAFPAQSFDAAVRTVGSRVNPTTRAVPVRAVIDNPDALLRPGMLMTVKLTTASRDALMVPETALLQRGMETFVYTVVDGKATMSRIELGIRRDGWAEAISGLTAGTEVVTEGVMKVRNGGPVRVAGDAGTE